MTPVTATVIMAVVRYRTTGPDPGGPMFRNTYHSTHPDMMAGASNQQLRDRHLVPGLFQPGEVTLDYLHDERFVIGGAAPTQAALDLPAQSEPASAQGKPFLQRREL